MAAAQVLTAPVDMTLDLSLKHVSPEDEYEYVAGESTTQPNTIHINPKGASSRYLEISFKRTVRVADNSTTNALPPSLGAFPLYKVQDFKAKLPETVQKKGGLFFPMYQREAMWIDLCSSVPFAIRIYVGGVNTVSGLPAVENEGTLLKRVKLLKENKSLQDYVVTPQQPWLDGVVSDDGVVRQFVAMPSGSGYSVEAQVAGEEFVKGIQFEVIPSYLPPPLPPVPVTICEPIGAPLSMTSNGQIYVKFLTGTVTAIHACASDTVDNIKRKVQDKHGIPSHLQRMIFGGKQMEDGRILGDYNIHQNDSIHLVLRLLGGGTDPTKGERVEMGLAAGGRIRQVIRTDRHPAKIWDKAHSILFNVQVVNSACFKAATGLGPPPTPITADVYAESGFPYFTVWNEAPSGIRGDFDEVKSVNELDKKAFFEGLKNDDCAPDVAKSIAEVEQSTINPIIYIDESGERKEFRPVSVVKQEVLAFRNKQEGKLRLAVNEDEPKRWKGALD